MLFLKSLMALTVLGLLIGKLWISTTELIIWDIRVDLRFMQVFHVLFVRKPRIRRYDHIVFVNIIAQPEPLVTHFNRFKNGRERVMLLATAERLRINNDLMFLVCGGDAVVALDRAFTRLLLGSCVFRN